MTAGSTAGAVRDGAKGLGSVLVSPIIEAWGGGNCTEAVTRGIAFAGDYPLTQGVWVQKL